MPVPQFLSDLLSLLYAIASPAAVLTLVAAGLSLRTEVE
jgi:pilus assembly protein TadC